MIDWTAVAAMATLLLAATTVWLGFQARAQVTETRNDERHRRAELQLLEAQPIIADVASVFFDRNEQTVLRFSIRGTRDSPIVGLRALLVAAPFAFSEVQELDIPAPGVVDQLEFVIEKLVSYREPEHRSGRVALVQVLELSVSSHGLLGQTVLQTFDVHLGRLFSEPSAGEPIVYQTSFATITDTSGDGPPPVATSRT